MATSRWKVMAGVLGVSLGGLAALAGQSPKVGETRRAQPPALPDLPAAVAPKPAGAPTLDVPPPASLPTLPAVLVTPPAALPILSEPPVADAKKLTPVVTPASGLALPTAPVVIPATAFGSAPLALPTVPTAVDPPAPKPTAPVVPMDVKPNFPEPAKTLPAPVVNDPLPTGFTPPTPTANVVEPVAVRSAPPAAVAAVAHKYRILLRVGEGEPTFEVRTGDDLMMKVVCEKVDIASSEKGQPMQQVKASGKVRFAGFGSEGTCDELSFIAGTGELQLAGNVTIQVKDKLGRVDSELKSDKVKYKLDASALPGVMKP